MDAQQTDSEIREYIEGEVGSARYGVKEALEYLNSIESDASPHAVNVFVPLRRLMEAECYLLNVAETLYPDECLP